MLQRKIEKQSGKKNTLVEEYPSVIRLEHFPIIREDNKWKEDM